jgi:hypothetical protein
MSYVSMKKILGGAMYCIQLLCVAMVGYDVKKISAHVQKVVVTGARQFKLGCVANNLNL